MKTISAEIVADSINLNGNRLTTMLITFPRIILPEFNTHRMISKNTSSSRAIPFRKKLAEVENNPFIPLSFQKDHKGMQGTEYMDYDVAVDLWLNTRDSAVKEAKALSEAGMTKQLVNRTIEAYTWTTMLVSGTEWENFFALRKHKDAEIHIQELASKMLEAMNDSTPIKIENGWHIPFGDKIDLREAWDAYIFITSKDRTLPVVQTDEELKAWISCARAARLSYETFDNEINYEKDLTLAFNLALSGHWSAFEHTSLTHKDMVDFHGNLKGWMQFRKSFQNENRKDTRLCKCEF